MENKNKKTNEELEAKRDLEFAEVEEEPIVVHKASKFGRSKKTKKIYNLCKIDETCFRKK